MSLIEHAARRLEQLRKAGIESSPQADASPRAPVREDPKPRMVPANGPAMAAPPRPAPDAEPTPASAQVEIDLERLAAMGFITPDAPHSRIANEFRIIKRPLIGNVTATAAAAVRNRNLIMVTSSVPGEGKTFASVNLAMSLAMEMDRTVLLVDADTPRPALPRTLGIEPGRGLLDILDGSAATLNEVLLRTNVPKLTFMSCGRQRAHASEMLASDAMSRLLDEMAVRYADRIIIFDSPPLLVTTEARVLAARMGQILFVIRAEKTLQNEVRQALATIENCPIKLQMLNAAKSPAQGLYGYGYGYEE